MCLKVETGGCWLGWRKAVAVTVQLRRSVSIIISIFIAVVFIFGRNVVIIRVIVVQLIQFPKATVELPDRVALIL